MEVQGAGLDNDATRFKVTQITRWVNPSFLLFWDWFWYVGELMAGRKIN